MRFSSLIIFFLGFSIVANLLSCNEKSKGPLNQGDETPSSTALHDPISMPESPVVALENFSGSAYCGECHETHYKQWQHSSHAYAMVDPVFQALSKVRQEDFNGDEDLFCTQCHSNIGTRSGDIRPGFDFNQLSPVTMEGVNCESCHRINAIQRDNNAGHVLIDKGPMFATLKDPQSPHEAEYSEFYEKAEYCGTCHDVVETNGIELERPYDEWLESPAAKSGETCQDCHMPESKGPAASGEADRKIHDHHFAGVDIPLLPGFVDKDQEKIIREKVKTLLGKAASLSLTAVKSTNKGDQVDLLVSVKNNISGHNLPTGTTFIRELWVEVTATDAEGKVVYQTGDLDENGDLRYHFSEIDPYGDNDILLFNSVLVDAKGKPVIYSWRAHELISKAIPPYYTRTHSLFIPTADAALGNLTIAARLRFRSHPPYLLRKLKLDDLVQRLEIHDIAEATTVLEIK